ncbi:MAG: hypothetical protein WAV20_17925, partial [Blastocatellia bacterium]
MSYPGYQPQGGYGAPPQDYAAPGGYGTPPQFAYAGMGKRFVAMLLDSLLVALGMVPGWILFAIAMVGVASTSDSRGQISNDAAGAFLGLFFLGYAAIFLGGALIW